ncbi:hypothetical protein [Leptothoe sp. PORK10 BA2]|uniref:hypothetical protein n=1 Tax=Leptothoe sp. PORK10 BA2 TaxID=3110254 RepID=UPI002B1ED20B|nr:hypothetical protein [Leptothoe sp. PORK10 BA2]MEA5466280.1 hypothetical protein [Leptothoe sp. PORK10 BA2]
MLMELCPCCGVKLLRHANKSGAYLRCGSCRLEIPEELPSATEANSKLTNQMDDDLETAQTTTAA